VHFSLGVTMKGELTVLRCLRIADVLKAEIGGDALVAANTERNEITITTERGTVIVLKAVSIRPV
jgi:hypothetical protein